MKHTTSLRILRENDWVKSNGSLTSLNGGYTARKEVRGSIAFVNLFLEGYNNEDTISMFSYSIKPSGRKDEVESVMELLIEIRKIDLSSGSAERN